MPDNVKNRNSPDTPAKEPEGAAQTGRREEQRGPSMPDDRHNGRRSATASDPGSLKARQDWLGRSLRKLYDDLANEPLPDSLTSLLEELERKDENGGR